MTHFNLSSLVLLLHLSLCVINQSHAMGIASDSLIYYDDLNGDGKKDLVTRLDKDYNFRIHLSSGKTFQKHEIKLKYCLADITSKIDVTSFSLLKMKTNLKFRLKILPELATERTLNVTYNQEQNDFEIFSYYDTTKDALDPDSLEVVRYNLLAISESLKNLNVPLSENVYSSNSSISFYSKRDIKVFCEELKNGNVRKYPKERLENFLESQPLNVNNLVAYNDVGYYLEQNKYYEEAAFILEIITQKFPDRTVAHLNLGDALWGLNKTDLALESYKTYSNLMRKSGKETLIPKKIIERQKNDNGIALNTTQSAVYDTVSATMPPIEEYEGLYTLKSCEGYRLQLEIKKNEEFRLKYKLLENSKIISQGSASVNGDYVVINNFVGSYENNSIIIHNYGNGVNGFQNFIRCEEKYVTFTK